MIADSKLVSVVVPSPNHSGKRVYPLTRVSVHCVVGQCYAKSLGDLFADAGFEASSNYGIGFDGKIGQYLPESYRSWCTSSYDNDNRAITIEVASDTFHPYKVTQAAYDALIKLLVDICKRNGKKKVIWFGDKTKSLSYQPKSDELLMTVHRWFANKACPGDYLYDLHPQIAAQVNNQLDGAAVTTAKKTETATLTFNYLALSGYTNVPAQVKMLQRLLRDIQYKGKDGKELTINSKFDANTDYAVRAFQKKNKLTVDGIVGPATWALLTGGKVK